MRELYLNKNMISYNGYYGFYFDKENNLIYRNHKLAAKGTQLFNKIVRDIKFDNFYIDGKHILPDYPFGIGEEKDMLMITINGARIYIGQIKNYDIDNLDIEALKLEALMCYRLKFGKLTKEEEKEYKELHNFDKLLHDKLYHSKSN